MKRFWFVVIFFLSACNFPVKEKSLAEEKAPKATAVVVPDLNDPLEYEVRKVISFDYDTSVWSDIGLLDSTIVLDLKYATTDNFVGEQMYECGRCFLRKEAAAQLMEAHKTLQKKGLGLKMFDCFRPRPVQWKLWKKVPDPRYVADPEKGSMHNRGAAVDLTIVGAGGRELDMGTAYDFFGPRAYPSFTELPENVLQNRQLLSSTMIKYGFKPIRTEWWHFSWEEQNYPLSDMLWKCE